MKLEWSPFAIEDRMAIFAFLETDNPRAAVRVDEAIRTQTRRLLQFPESGRPGRIAGTRELVVSGISHRHPVLTPDAAPFDDPDNPEWTEAMFARANPPAAVLSPEVLAAFKRPRGRLRRQPAHPAGMGTRRQTPQRTREDAAEGDQG